MWVDALAKMPTWQRRHSLGVCLPDQARGASGGRRRHAMVVEALAPPGAAHVAIRIATRGATLVATVYTNAPKRRRGAILANLCTLLRPHTAVRNGAAAQQCTQTPQSGAERSEPPICVHCCVPTVAHTILASQQCTQMPQNGADRPFSAICVHSCVIALAVTPTPP